MLRLVLPEEEDDDDNVEAEVVTMRIQQTVQPPCASVLLAHAADGAVAQPSLVLSHEFQPAHKFHPAEADAAVAAPLEASIRLGAIDAALRPYFYFNFYTY